MSGEFWRSTKMSSVPRFLASNKFITSPGLLKLFSRWSVLTIVCNFLCGIIFKIATVIPRVLTKSHHMSSHLSVETTILVFDLSQLPHVLKLNYVRWSQTYGTIIFVILSSIPLPYVNNLRRIVSSDPFTWTCQASWRYSDVITLTISP